MRTIALALLTFASVASADDKAGKDEIKKLEGTWEVVAVTAGGMDMPKHGLPKKLVIKDGKMSGGPKVIALATDATKAPKWLNWTWDGEEFTAHGIYELYGGESGLPSLAPANTLRRRGPGKTSPAPATIPSSLSPQRGHPHKAPRHSVHADHPRPDWPLAPAA